MKCQKEVIKWTNQLEESLLPQSPELNPHNLFLYDLLLLFFFTDQSSASEGGLSYKMLSACDNRTGNELIVLQ